ncbi:hypothetical protein K469DRAFT_611726 [Zopfia rhizophila CBS 207.26]|uniref:Uncharacterized protein n=1 Tax=Zopfia rhizophila CBS 207.26 TaxID=1314779 RepID=A0A6A6D7U9_9PEZI|nr:hypothetical protein K469DRAFT_611726 [Zopfia rhizophila CBS 207.26]
MGDKRSGYRLNSLAKKWDLKYSKDRKIKEDGSYVEFKRSKNAVDDSIGLFLQDSESPVPSSVVEEVTEFCQEVSLRALKSGTGMVGERQAAWLDDRDFSGPESSGRAREYNSQLTATELYRHLKVQRFDNPDMPDAERRLIYIANLDPYYMLAIAETASYSQVRVLRDAIWNHLATQALISVQIPPKGFPFFQLELHLPYLALRALPPNKDHSQKRGYRNPLRRSTDLSFLLGPARNSRDQRTYLMHEAHISFVVCGSDDSRWVAYAFEEDDRRDLCEGDYDDPIASNGALFANEPLRNPREYFLTILKVRMAQVLQEWQYVVRKLERSIGYVGLRIFSRGYV